MKPNKGQVKIGLGLAFLALMALHLSGADREAETDLPPPRPRPDVEQLRQKAGKVSSAEDRQKFIRELQERRGLAGTNRQESLIRREEFRKLTPEERAKRLREIRQRTEQGQPRYHVMTPEERNTKRLEIKQRVDGQIEALKKQQQGGGLTDVEQRRLDRMEAMSKRLEQGQVLGPK
jgi:hypothetical protein